MPAETLVAYLKIQHLHYVRRYWGATEVYLRYVRR
jgi:hypothetical protein